MKFFLDTEFAERPCTIDLLSVGIVAEDGRKFYGINAQFDLKAANEFVKTKVYPNLFAYSEQAWVDAMTEKSEFVMSQDTRAGLAKAILEFIGDDKPEFWGYYADYDWTIFCWLFGTMTDLPKGWPMYCRDLKQLADQHDLRLPYWNDSHNALLDAIDLKRNYEYVMDMQKARQVLSSPNLPPGCGGSRDH